MLLARGAGYGERMADDTGRLVPRVGAASTDGLLLRAPITSGISGFWRGGGRRTLIATIVLTAPNRPTPLYGNRPAMIIESRRWHAGARWLLAGKIDADHAGAFAIDGERDCVRRGRTGVAWARAAPA